MEAEESNVPGLSGPRGTGVEILAKYCPERGALGGRVLVLPNQTGSTIDPPNINPISSKKWHHRIDMGIEVLVYGEQDTTSELKSDVSAYCLPSTNGVGLKFVEWAQNEIAVVPDFHKRILFSDEAHFWLNGYVNKQNCRIWSEANPQVYVETPLHPEKLTVWCALWAGGILQKR
ncbi:hypothetical protein TNCV_3785701 [Trichonephila clavipes]|nr:hypothetical protein TNCV_3785701 [Trichonephila clavipes]